MLSKTVHQLLPIGLLVSVHVSFLIGTRNTSQVSCMTVLNTVASHTTNKHISLSIPSICDRDPGHASTSYDSPRFAQRSSDSFTSRRSDPRGYSPSYSQDRYADRYDDSSSFDSRQGNSMAPDESSDEGELRPVNRFVHGLLLSLMEGFAIVSGLLHAQPYHLAYREPQGQDPSKLHDVVQ